MGFKYTRSELAQLTGLSVETIKKRALKMSLKEEFKTVNNRDVIAYDLSESDLQELKHALNTEIPFETPFKTVQPEFDNSVNVPKNTVNPLDLTDKLIELSKYNDDRVEKYIERALKAENQKNLIETSEANKDKEIHRLNALLKECNLKVESLEKELAEAKKPPQKTFFGIKI